MYWLVYDTKTWQPGMEDLRALLKTDLSLKMRISHDAGPRHPFFALWFGLHGLRALNAGLVISEQADIPAGLSIQDDGPFTHAFAPTDDQAVMEALMRLNDNKLFHGVMNDALDINQSALNLRQKLGMMGRLNRWRRDLDQLGEVTDRLMTSGEEATEISPDWVIDPLNKIFGDM